MLRLNAAAAGALLLASPALAASPPATPADIAVMAENGTYVFRSGETSLPLYTYDRDEAGKSNCSAGCAIAWPPLAVSKDASSSVGDWSQIRRDDGQMQWAYKDQPVYTFASDTAGKANGDGLGGVWHLVPSLPAK